MCAGAAGRPAVGDTDGPFALEQNPLGISAAADLEILPPARLAKVAARSADTPSVLDRTLHIADTSLGAIVVVGIARQAGCGDARDKSLGQGRDPLIVRDRNRSASPADLIIAFADAALGLFEIGQNVVVAPAFVAGLRPGIEVRRQATVVDHSVDRGRTTQCLSLRGENRSAIGPGATFRLELPSHLWIEQQLDDAGGDPDQRVVVLRSRLKQADGDVGVLREPRGQDATGGTTPHNHIIEGCLGAVGGHSGVSLIPALRFMTRGRVYAHISVG